MLRIGLLGSGNMASVYADRIGTMPDAVVTAVSSPNTAEAFVDDHVPTATPYNDPDTLCSSGDVDAVAVLSPTDTHAELIELAAEHDLDVICEKPLARTMAGAERIRSTVDSSDIACMVAHVTRFFPEYAEAKALIDAGDIGTPGVVRTERSFGFEGSRGWFEDTSRSGGILLDLAVHDFDFLRWAIGEVDRVYTRRTEWEGDGYSEATVTLLRFSEGAVGHVESWVAEDVDVPFSTAFDIAGDDGHIAYDLDDVAPFVSYDSDGRAVPRDPIGDDMPLYHDGYYRQIESFVECVESDSPVPVDVEDAIESMRVALAAIESADRGEPVDVAEVRT